MAVPNPLLRWNCSNIVDPSNIGVSDQNACIVFCLYPLSLLAEDITVNTTGMGFRGVTLAYNARQKEDVQKALDQAASCGATIVKYAQDVFWGGHSGYFSDPDGHYWEIAWNPHWKIGQNLR